jgi:hypothetical protein
LQKFFETVLPCHYSLRDIIISHSRIQTQYWRLFTENVLIQDYRLRQLALKATPLNGECCSLLLNMLRRQVSLYILSIDDCGLGADEWELVCNGVADNGHTHTLTLIERNVTVGRTTLLPVYRLTCPVDRLVVHAATWADDDDDEDGAFGRFLRPLLTGEDDFRTLTLHRSDRGFPHLPLVVELLTEYRWARKGFTLHPDPANDPAWGERVQRARSGRRRLRRLARTEPATRRRR